MQFQSLIVLKLPGGENYGPPGAALDVRATNCGDNAQDSAVG